MYIVVLIWTEHESGNYEIGESYIMDLDEAGKKKLRECLDGVTKNNLTKFSHFEGPYSQTGGTKG
jgi:hypothetical protein